MGAGSPGKPTITDNEYIEIARHIRKKTRLIPEQSRALVARVLRKRFCRGLLRQVVFLKRLTSQAAGFAVGVEIYLAEGGARETPSLREGLEG